MTRPVRRPPSMEALLGNEAVRALAVRFGRTRTKAALRRACDLLRRGALPDEAALVDSAARELGLRGPAGPRRVVNATGVLLHTNLGRAPLAEAALQAVREAAGYCTLEYEPESGRRGRRGDHVVPLVLELFAPDREDLDAALTTNTAAALLLAFDTVANGRPVAVSRGELVAIGGDFRVPSILARSGATLAEVGTTNKTTREDYEAALDAGAAAILKVHPSNYRIVGFTQEVGLAELGEVARHAGVPLVFDAGSGAPRRFAEPGLADQPVPLEALEAGADLVCFSGDKTLGGPQTGILLGLSPLIARANANPLARALRPDKLVLAALAATLELHLSGREGEVPFHRMLRLTLESLDARAARVVSAALEQGYGADVIASIAVAGGGSGTESTLPSRAVALRHPACSADALAARLRALDVPIVGRVSEDRLVLDLRTVAPEEDALLVAALKELTSPT
ncbi:MAG: L-seryl-tRNA(Sec) selenium transferase [Thermoanaerobaculia bacterium]